MESTLLLTLLVACVLAGTSLAVIRPALFRLGQDGTPVADSGVRYLGSYRSGRWRPERAPTDWNRFQGRGPGGAK